MKKGRPYRTYSCSVVFPIIIVTAEANLHQFSIYKTTRVEVILKFDSTTKKACTGVNRLKLSFMSPTTARRTSSKEKNEWRTEKFNAQIRKCEKKSDYTN